MIPCFIGIVDLPAKRLVAHEIYDSYGGTPKMVLLGGPWDALKIGFRLKKNLIEEALFFLNRPTAYPSDRFHSNFFEDFFG